MSDNNTDDSMKTDLEEKNAKFKAFLEARRVSGKDKNFTHTKVSNCDSGKYYIESGKDNVMFQKLYCDIFKFYHQALSEKQQNIGPLMTDYDFEFGEDNKERVYTLDDIVRTIQVLNEIIYDTLEVDKDDIKAYVTEKKFPTIEYEDEKDEDGKDVLKRVKDGFHICYILPLTRLQRLYIYNKLKERAIRDDLYDNIPFTNEYENILDISTIDRNNWMMYGSIKKMRKIVSHDKEEIIESQVYRLTHIFNYELEEEPIEYKPEDLVYLFSVRQFSDDEEDALDIRSAVSDDFETFQKLLEKKKDKKERKLVEHNLKQVSIIPPKIQIAKKLVGILSNKRAESYDDWIRVCWTLRSVGDDLYDEFIEFSKKSKKFDLNSCNTFWHSPNTYSYTIASLYWWARQDNSDKYNEIIKENLDKVFIRIEEGTSTDIAQIIHALYPCQFACSAIQGGPIWYEFKNHRWSQSDCGSAIRKIIKDDISELVAETGRRYFSAAKGQNDNGVVMNTNKAEKLLKLAKKLRDTNMLNSVIRECADEYLISDFEKKLDANMKLIGFENGIYDLETGKFREGTPDDYVMFSTGYNYKEYNGDEQVFADIEQYFCQIQTNSKIREYLMKTCAGYLDGQNRDQKFQIWTGSGCHSPDTEILMYDGSIKMAKDVKVGDLIMGDDSKPRHVQRLFTGTQDMFKVTLYDGTSMTVNANHRLALKSTYDGEVYYDDNSKAYVVEYHVRGTAYPTKQFRVFKEDQYTTKKCVENLATRFLDEQRNSSEMVRKGHVIPVTVLNYLDMPEEVRKHYVCYRNSLYFNAKPILGDAYKLGYALTSGHIPTTYMFNTAQIRERLLTGILDKFGYINNEHVYLEISDGELQRDIVFLCRSLGYHVKTVTDITIELIGKFSHLKCLQLKIQHDTQHSLEYEFHVEKLGAGQFVGFGVDKNERYVLQNLIVTYNSNGKSLTTSLLKRTYGKYFGAFDHTILTRKRGGSSNATPELADKNGVRMGIMQEPEEDDTLYVSFLKQLSGEDDLNARPLYRPIFTYLPQFKLIMICNVLPTIKATDNGTWRRITVIPFDSEFVDFPPEKPNQFPRDNDMSKKMKEWHIPFMWLLLHKYYPLWLEGNHPPSEVEIKTDQYKRSCDMYRDFIASYCDITKSDNDKIQIDDMFQAFKEWFKGNSNGSQCPIKRIFLENLERSLGLKALDNKILRVKRRTVKETDVEIL